MASSMKRPKSKLVMNKRVHDATDMEPLLDAPDEITTTTSDDEGGAAALAVFDFDGEGCDAVQTLKRRNTANTIDDNDPLELPRPIADESPKSTATVAAVIRTSILAPPECEICLCAIKSDQLLVALPDQCQHIATMCFQCISRWCRPKEEPNWWAVTVACCKLNC